MKRSLIPLTIASALVIFATSVSVSTSPVPAGSFLYCGKTPVKTGSTATCYQFARDSMQRLGFQNIRSSAIEVAGSKGGTYAAITCVGTTPQATAMVMVVGGNQSETAQARDDLRNKIAGLIRFD